MHLVTKEITEQRLQNLIQPSLSREGQVTPAGEESSLSASGSSRDPEQAAPLGRKRTNTDEPQEQDGQRQDIKKPEIASEPQASRHLTFNSLNTTRTTMESRY